MLRWSALMFALILFAIGLCGFWFGRLGNLVQLDLFQSFVYLITGGVGLKLGLTQTPQTCLRRYVGFIAWLSLGLLALGLTLPNFRDIVHLELYENIFHAVLGVTAALIVDPPRWRPRLTSHH